uniref:Uncharacterized protein n=1 Tax=Clytia hemisphaerica TaxID=252671 RepID=A0A7M5XBL6_9CNID|eukprot:TCONS_00009111-protein
MVNKLRKTLSDHVVKRLSQIIDRSRPSSDEFSDNDEDDVINANEPCKLRSKTPSFIKRQMKFARRMTVTGCDGHQIVDNGIPWYYNDHTETTVDRFGVKTTSFCASEL